MYMQRINTWKIDNILCDNNDKIIQDIQDINLHSTYLLDLSKDKYSLIEKYVYDIAVFHFARLNIHKDNQYVEFWFKTESIGRNKFHVDCDESFKIHKPTFICPNNYKYPILSSVTYLNDSYNTPTCLTNVDVPAKYTKDYENQTEIILSLAKCNKHITFNGNLYHASSNLNNIEYTIPSNRYIIAINLWDIKPGIFNHPNYCNDIIKYNNIYTNIDKKQTIVSIHPDDAIYDVKVDNNIINYQLFIDMLHTSKYTQVCYRFDDIIKKYHSVNGKHINTFKFILDDSIKSAKTNYSGCVHTFIISKSALNRESIIEKIKNTNIKEYTIIDAVDGNTELDKYDFKLMPNWIDPIHKREINVGEIGSFLSHYFTWKYIIDHNITSALIIEDDCIFMDTFNHEIENILDCDTQMYDYFTLGRKKLNNLYNLGPEIDIIYNYVIPKYSRNTHSYILTNSGAKILSNELVINNIIPVDDYISIMYDSFPFAKYSDYFKNMPKLRALGLNYDITR